MVSTARAPDNAWLGRRVLHYAHQGGAREAPSSTLYALERAVATGADALELDVHATADGVLVVCHDTSVERTTAGSGRIASLTLDELRRLDNAYWWVPGTDATVDAEPHEYVLRGRAPDDPRLGIATLESVLEAFPGVFLNLDIKETAPAVAGYERVLADLLRAHGRVEDVIVASFHDVATARLRDYAPEFHTSLGTADTVAFHLHVRAGGPLPERRHGQVALQVPVRFQDVTVVDEVFVDRAHAVGLAVHVWTVDDPDEMRWLIDIGVDGIMTDVPSVLEAVLQDRRAAFDG